MFEDLVHHLLYLVGEIFAHPGSPGWIYMSVALDSGELAARHRRVFAGGLTFTDPAHQAALEELRGERKRRRREPEVEVRPLARYDALIPA